MLPREKGVDEWGGIRLADGGFAQDDSSYPELALKGSKDYTDNCHTDSETLNIGDFVFQENNRQRYCHNG